MVKNIAVILSIVIIVALAGFLIQQQTDTITGMPSYVKIGGIQGDASDERRRDSSAIGFEYDVTTPRDVTSGQQAGRRAHDPDQVAPDQSEPRLLSKVPRRAQFRTRSQ